MHIRRLAALAAALLVPSAVAIAQAPSADTLARSYFARACADKAERVAVYAPEASLFQDITVGATRSTSSWDRYRFERLCLEPELYVYHCHTTEDVLTRFPSGSEGAVPGDFGNAAEMEFSCAKAAVLSHHAPASLIHGLVTPKGEVVTYGFSPSTLDALRARGRNFGDLLGTGAARGEIERALAEAQDVFSSFNARHLASVVQFAVKACPDGDIEHCAGFTLERFAASLPADDWRFIRAGADPAATPTSASEEAAPVALAQGLQSPAATLPLGATARPRWMTTELTPETLGAFVSEGPVMVSICARGVEELVPCEVAKARIDRLAASCPHAKTGILDQDKYPDARFIYPVARDRSLLLFKTNPQSGVNEQFNLTTMGEPTPQLIGMVLCDRVPFALPSIAQ
jgi:hypothetical protein